MAKRINWTIIVRAIAVILATIVGIKVINYQKAKGNNISQTSIVGNNNPIQETKGNNNVAVSGNHNQIFVSISTLRSDNGMVPDKGVDSLDINSINLYKFQSLWDTNIGFYDGGSRNSYSSLLNMEKSDNPTMKKLASDAVKTIKNAYDGSNINVMVLNIERWGYICRWSVPPCANGYEPSIGYNAKNVFDHLDYKKWQERARAACLLRNVDSTINTHRDQVDKKEFCDKLVNLMGEQEPSLFVSKMALETYKALTGFSSLGVFDFEGAIKDWENPERKEKILKINF